MALDLQHILEGVGIIPTHESRKEIHARCPLHEQRTGKPDVHPSWSINRHTFVHSCFSCGYRGTLTGLLVDLTGSAPDDLEKTLATESFLRKMQEVRQDPAPTLDPVEPILTEWALHNIHTDVPDRLLDIRHLQRYAVDRYDIRWDTETKRWVIPVRSPEGELVGAQYRQKGSVYTTPGMSKSTTLFGFPQCCDSSFCAVTESPLDAVRLFGLGIPALSPLGAWISREQVTLLARNFCRVYLALDNDKTGREAAEQVQPKLVRAGCAPIRWSYQGLTDEDGQPAKDVGDVEGDDVLLASWARTQRMGL